jgi:hypothetical protein
VNSHSRLDGGRTGDVLPGSARSWDGDGGGTMAVCGLVSPVPFCHNAVESISEPFVSLDDVLAIAGYQPSDTELKQLRFLMFEAMTVAAKNGYARERFRDFELVAMSPALLGDSGAAPSGVRLSIYHAGVLLTPAIWHATPLEEATDYPPQQCGATHRSVSVANENGERR